MTPSSLRERRIALGLSPQQFAEALGVDVDAVASIETIHISDEVTFLANLTLSLFELEPAPSFAASDWSEQVAV